MNDYGFLLHQLALAAARQRGFAQNYLYARDRFDSHVTIICLTPT